jgi:hypothetical protein
MSDTPPLCKNCKHMTIDEGPTCIRPLSRQRSVVDGELVDRLFTFCWNERHDGKTLFTRRERCGKWGRYFEEKAA